MKINKYKISFFFNFVKFFFIVFIIFFLINFDEINSFVGLDTFNIRTKLASYLPLLAPTQKQIIITETKEVVKHETSIKKYTKKEIIQLLRYYADIYNIPFSLAYAIAKHESNIEQMRSRYETKYFKCHILGKKCKKLKFPTSWQEELKDVTGQQRMATSIGVMQLMPYTALRTVETVGVEACGRLNSPLELYDAEKNICIGVAYLSI